MHFCIFICARKRIRFLHIEAIEVEIEIVPVIDARQIDLRNLRLRIIAFEVIGTAEIAISLSHNVPAEFPARIDIEVTLRCHHAAVIFAAIKSVGVELARFHLMNTSDLQIIAAVFKAMAPFSLRQEALLRVSSR